MIRSLFIVWMLTVYVGSAFASNDPVLQLDTTGNWIEFISQDGITIEYQFVECNSENVKNQALYILRFTNTTNTEKSISWSVKSYRNGECANCHRIDRPEYARSVSLQPGEVLEGTCLDRTDNRLFLFSNFIKLVPGMTEDILTNFEFVNLVIE